MSDTPEVAKKKKKKGNPWVENIESLVVAVILALIIRTFVLEAFVIPTGSMAATLYGNHYELKCANCGYEYAFGGGTNGRSMVLERVRCPNCGTVASGLSSRKRVSGGDKILVNKMPYLFGEPDRWDPFVFVNPNVKKSDDKPYKTTYIKRLVGMPDETLEILRGDILVNGKVLRKPASAQSRLWMPVYDSDYVWKQDSAWEAPTGAWKLDGKRLVADCPAGETSWVRYRGRRGDRDDSGTVYDTYGYDHDMNLAGAPMVRTGAGLNVVTDLRVAFDAKGTVTGRLEMSLIRDRVQDVAIIDFAKGLCEIRPAGETPRSKTFDEIGFVGLSENDARRISFHRLDYLLVLAIDDRAVLDYDLWDDASYRTWVALSEMSPDDLPGYDRSGVQLEAAGAKLELTGLKIHRDIYYTYRRPGEGVRKTYKAFRIPKGCYFAMGDNSPESWDSRYWPGGHFVPRDHLIGKALVIWWHPMRLRFVR